MPSIGSFPSDTNGDGLGGPDLDDLMKASRDDVLAYMDIIPGTFRATRCAATSPANRSRDASVRRHMVRHRGFKRGTRCSNARGSDDLTDP
jgi:hypothetical protein